MLSGCYEPPPSLPPEVTDFIAELEMPQSVRALGPQSMAMSVHQYQSFWNKAKENVSCHPGTLSFSTIKSGTTNNTIAQVECCLTRIPLLSGYSPKRGRKCTNVMIQIRSGVTHLSGLRTIVLFPVDANYARLQTCWKRNDVHSRMHKLTSNGTIRNQTGLLWSN